MHIHHKLLGSYCLALRVWRGGWDKQWMTNVKWVSGNLLRRGQVSRLCCTLQYVLWTVEEAQLCTMSLGAGKPGLKILDQMLRYEGFVLILCFPSYLIVSSCSLPDCQMPLPLLPGLCLHMSCWSLSLLFWCLSLCFPKMFLMFITFHVKKAYFPPVSPLIYSQSFGFSFIISGVTLLFHSLRQLFRDDRFVAQNNCKQKYPSNP